MEDEPVTEEASVAAEADDPQEDDAKQQAEAEAEVATTAGPEQPAEPDEPADPADWGSVYSSMVRLGAGLVGTVLDRAQSADVDTPEEAPPSEPTHDIAVDGDPIGSVVVGFAADLPDRFGRVTSAVSEGTGPVRSVVSWGWRVTAASPIGWVIAGPVDAVRDRMDVETERLAAIGRSEYAEGRVLFEKVVDNAIDGVLDNVSESDALLELIRDAALGMGDAAIEEVRETGAAADQLTDSIVRKLLRRDPRDLPPMPANGSE